MTDRAETADAEVTNEDTCVAFVNRVGLCLWQRRDRLPDAFPTLEAATPWTGMDLYLNTWFWKDDLHIEKRLFYGQIVGAGVPAFASLAFLPYLIAAQGDNDPRTLYEQGRLSHNALVVYEHVARNGPTATNALPWPPGSRHANLAVLQQKFLLTKHDLTGRTRGKYGYVWGLCDAHVPEAFTAAARIPVEDARAHVRAHLANQGVEWDDAQATRFFRWPAP